MARATTRTAGSLSDLSDEELMERIREKNREALGELYLRYGRLVSGAVVAAVPMLPKEEVEDLAQDVFIAVEQGSGAYTERGKLKAWLYSIATRVARKRSRSAGVFNRIRSAVADSRSGLGAVTGGRPDADAIARIDLERALRRLSLVQREVLILFEHHGLSGDEIAELLDLSVNTVWSHLRRARGRLLVLMAPEEEGRG